MLNIMKLSRIFPVIVMIAMSYQSADSFEVKGKAISTTFCAQEHCETDTCNDEVIYEVDLGNSTVTRKAVVNKGKSVQGTSFGGLQVTILFIPLSTTTRPLSLERIILEERLPACNKLSRP